MHRNGHKKSIVHLCDTRFNAEQRIPKGTGVGASNIYLSEPALSMTRSWKRRLTAMCQSSEWQQFVTIQINRFIDCFIECLRVCLLACMIDSLIHWLIHSFIHSSIRPCMHACMHAIIHWLIDWLIDRLKDWRIDGLIDWSIDWLIHWFIDPWIGRLVYDCLNDCLVRCFMDWMKSGKNKAINDWLLGLCVSGSQWHGSNF